MVRQAFECPVALVGYLHRDLVEDRKRISEEEYKDWVAVVGIIAD